VSELRSNEAAEPLGLFGPRTLTSAIYGHLRADILAGRYRPSEKLPVAPIAKRFEVSFAAVREALSRLVADGLVSVEDQRGFRVSPLSVADLNDVTHTRIELECLALRRSILRGDDDWRRDLQQAWDALRRTPYTTPKERLRHNAIWSGLHGHFHAALVAACGLGWLLRFRATLYEQSERYRMLGMAVSTGERDVAAEHRRIFEASMSGDSAAAEAELTRHFTLTATSIAEALDGQMLSGTTL
jgi:DNA-binding GntR family transcriptional regulator